MKQNIIAYPGAIFTIEWYMDDNSKSNALDYFLELPFERQKKIFHLFRLLGNSGKIFNEEKFRHEGDQIYVFKPSSDRFFCFFFDGAKVIVTNAYEKKTAKMPPREKQKALNAKADYVARCKKGTYYD